MGTCPISIMAGNDCSSAADQAIFAFHHIEAFGQFTQATLSSGIAALVLLLLASIVLLKHCPPKAPKGDIYNNPLLPKRDSETSFIQHQILRWLALHNKRGSDSHVPVAGL